ncbi:major capsid protein [Mycobacterium phage OhShagHennessy]|uniref:Major capsid protein n=1 Tax=Mycobacterium phage OhShagHennessy TaxID=2801895 RepID=A0A7U0J798_9CAUD|nr:major head protein [Mycobacterium phage OhShagHennessy]QQV92711.1 major capsid protein [Mycobacterium phage OhShagHennessy]
MAHIFVKPELVAEIGVKQLQREIVLPSLVWTNPLTNFGGSKNDTITVRVPAITTANSRDLRDSDRSVTTSELVEHSFGVTLDKHIYAALKFTDEQRTLDIRDYTAQVLVPQVSAVAYKLEDYIAQLIENAPYEETILIDPEDTVPAFITADQRLGEAFVPNDQRVLVVGSAVAAALAKDKQFRHADWSGDQANSALREAHVGRLAGMNVIKSLAIAPDKAYVWHKTAFILAYRTPVVPEGAKAGASFSANGVALRWLADYDYSNLGDRTLLDVFTGRKVVTEVDGSFVRAQELQLTTDSISIVGGDFALLTTTGTKQLKVRDSNGTDVTARCTFSSSATGKATVSATGKVTGVADGEATITASYVPPQGGAAKTATAKVTVPA